MRGLALGGVGPGHARGAVEGGECLMVVVSEDNEYTKYFSANLSSWKSDIAVTLEQDNIVRSLIPQLLA